MVQHTKQKHQSSSSSSQEHPTKLRRLSSFQKEDELIPNLVSQFLLPKQKAKLGVSAKHLTSLLPKARAQHQQQQNIKRGMMDIYGNMLINIGSLHDPIRTQQNRQANKELKSLLWKLLVRKLTLVSLPKDNVDTTENMMEALEYLTHNQVNSDNESWVNFEKYVRKGCIAYTKTDPVFWRRLQRGWNAFLQQFNDFIKSLGVHTLTLNIMKEYLPITNVLNSITDNFMFYNSHTQQTSIISNQKIIPELRVGQTVQKIPQQQQQQQMLQDVHIW